MDENPKLKQLQELSVLKKKKSDLIIHLNDKENGKRYKEICKEIGNYELIITDAEIERGENVKAISNLISAIKFFKLENKSLYVNDLILKILMDKRIETTLKDTFITLYNKEFERKPLKEGLIDFIKFIITVYIDNEIETKNMNLNKTSLYTFDQLNYAEFSQAMFLLPEITKLTNPFYSSQVQNILEKMEASNSISLREEKYVPSKNYIFILNGAKNFSSRAKGISNELFSKIEESIKKFSKWTTEDIEDWERGLDIFRYFEYGDQIS